MNTPSDPFEHKSRTNVRRTGTPIGSLGKWTVYDVRRGGMGEVFLCKDSADDEEKPPIALKTFQQRFFLNHLIRTAFLREAAIWSRLSGTPGIVPIHGLLHIDGRPFVLMPAFRPEVADPTLRGMLRKGALPADFAYAVGLRIATALLHGTRRVSGLVHGDLKPENVIVSTNGMVWITDFGLAQAAGMATLSALETTWAYRAPESWAGAAISVAADVYAFGVMLYELACGRLPFAAETREEWQEAHLQHEPATAAAPDAAAAPLVELARHCMSKAPKDRPRDFAVIASAMLKSGNPIDVMPTMYSIIQQDKAFEEMRARLRPTIIQNLLDLEEPRLALTELDDIPRDSMHERLWILRGTTLSLLNQDEEALVCYERAEALAPDPETRILLECERGLSLKRLKRYSEAIALYKRLLPTVENKWLANVVLNLSTVFMEAGRSREAVPHLVRFTRKHPTNGIGWANLGAAREQLGEYEDAARCYQRAFGESRQLAHVLVWHARVCMEQFGNIEQAWQSLDVAFDCGVDSRELTMRLLACALLRRDESAVGALMVGIRRNLSADDAEALPREAYDMAQSIVHKFSTASEDRAAGGEQVKDTEASAAAEIETPVETPLAETNASAAAEPSGFGIPFVNFRYTSEGLLLIDIYDDIGDSGIANRVIEIVRQAERDPRIQSGTAELSAHPFYFTRCDGCGFEILTNRPEHYKLDCRACDFRSSTRAIPDPTGGAVAAIHTALDRGVAKTDEVTVWLLVSATEPDQMDRVEKIMTADGWVIVPRDIPVVQHLAFEIHKSGFEVSDKSLAFRIVVPSIIAAGSETPVEVERVVRQLRRQVGNALHTASSTVSTADRDAATLMFQGEYSAAEGELRRQLADAPLDAPTLSLLSLVLQRLGKLDEAARRAQQALDLAPDRSTHVVQLASIMEQQGRTIEAISILERGRALDPSDVSILGTLARCHAALGHDQDRQELLARIRSLGGPF